ncbi:ATP-binding protein [Xenophilus arseniciresistens]|uniref:histidine kinase n=1 Tax=Xenophilus arseniciresistens TaxID=1283306 RepID=A0AAE3N561_9BURK|nr:ATP-binding protein [Xenophilus arseniciresistens]MDA7415088.1 ATP-binding protein [Xenophilus arseniciresistens]
MTWAPHRLRRGQGWSLRRRLLLTVMGVSISLWLVSLGIVIGVAWFATSEVYDDALEEGSRLVLQLGAASGQGAGADALRAGRGGALKLRLVYQLVAADGRVLQRGEDAPEAAFVPPAELRSDDYATVRADGELWRVHMRRGEGGLSAQVAQPMQERLELLEDMAENLAWPALLLLAVLGLLSWVLIRRLLRPLEEAATRIAAKSPQDLSAVDAQGLPRELRPIVDALDALLMRLGQALESERRFTADAAHELRTPLAALRMRVQLAQRESRLPDAHLAQLRADVDRCTALVESLLALTRLEPQAQPLLREPVDLAELLDTLAPALPPPPAAHLQRALAVARVPAVPTLLASALRNLIANAVHYGPPGVTVRVESGALPGGGVRIAVRDDGPGVPPDQRARLGERFFRVLGTGRPGNGLGLSIVARIAALHGAPLRFEEGIDGHGLGVVLDFPPG